MEFLRSSGCDAPISIRYDPPRSDGKGGFVYSFPADCGKCLPCLVKRKQQWSYRMTEEQRSSFSSYFVTLTYNDKFVPHGDDGLCGNKEDHKDFIKWLRYYEDPKILSKRGKVSLEELARKRAQVKTGSQRLKYYGVIEYGKKGRPHFHYILFNVIDSVNIDFAWSKQVRISKGIYEPGERKGFTDVQECNVNTIDYVLKYMMKIPGEEKDLQKEVSFCSKGLGLCAMDNEIIDHIKKPENNQVINVRGSRVALPRYYNKKFVTDEERDKKRRHVEHEVKMRELKNDEDMRREGIDIGKFEVTSKEHRFKTLKNQPKRDFE